MSAGQPLSSGAPRPRLTRRRGLLFLIALVIVVGLGWLLRDFVRDNIVGPLALFGWAVWIFLQSVPQFVYWGLFLLVALFAAGRSLMAGRAIEADVSRLRAPRRQAISRFHYWQRMLESMGGNTFSRERVLHDLQWLVLQVLAEHDRVDLNEMRARLLRGELDLSREHPAIQALLDPTQRRSLLLETSAQPRGLRAWLSRLFGRAPLPARDQVDVPAIVAWLERETGKIEPQ